MAIRQRKGRAKAWEVYWNNPFTGKRQTANFATKAEAKKHDALVKYQLQYETEIFKPTEAEVESACKTISLNEVYTAYLKQKGFSKADLRWQMFCMRPILAKLGSKDVTAISRQDVLQLLNADMQSHLSNASVRNRYSVFRAVLRWAADQGYRGPVEYPRLPAANYKKFVPPSPDELAAIMQIAAPHIQRIVILGAQCGVRVGPSEVLRLTWEDVDLTRRILRVHGAKKNKNAPWREVPIREQLVPVFEQWKQEDQQTEARHLVNYNGKPVGDFHQAWKRTLDRAGVRHDIRPYDLRHAFATEAIAAGVDVGTVASLMGHSSPTMIFNHYQFVLNKQKRAAVEALPGIEYVAKSCGQKKKHSQ